MGRKGSKVVLCDTNVILEFYKSNPEIIRQLTLIREENIRISIITSMEVVAGVLNKREMRQMVKSLGAIEVYDLAPTIGNKALELMQQYALSHNLDMPDALIAATALEKDVELYTLNLKHFRYLPELKLYAPVI